MDGGNRSIQDAFKKGGSVRIKQLPARTAWVKITGSKLTLLGGCPLDNMKFWKNKLSQALAKQVH